MGSGRRILIIVGTRPEAIKLVPVIAALRSDPRFDARVCVSAQHRELLDQVFAVAGIRPDHDLDLMRPGQSLDGLVAALVERLGRVLDEVAPASVLVQGDTSTAMCGALAAYHRRIPVDHIEAGLRSHDLNQPWPEEGNRRMIGALARLHFAPTERAAAALRRENVAPQRIHITGNTVIDALHWVSARIAADPSLAGGLLALERRFAGKRIIGITSHRRESFGGGLEAIVEALRRIAARDDVALVFPIHPNPQVRRVVERALSRLDNVALIEPLDYPHFVRLLTLAAIIVTDSGGVQEEAPALGKPVLVTRRTTERPEGVESGTARLVGPDTEAIVIETVRLLDDPEAYSAMARAHNPYGDGKAAARIVELLAREI
ncbi:MAG: UDP-N-acetylglucosamine 2-epimerase (non-hydrolyzing) [Novosphingobium sp.]